MEKYSKIVSLRRMAVRKNNYEKHAVFGKSREEFRKIITKYIISVTLLYFIRLCRKSMEIKYAKGDNKYRSSIPCYVLCGNRVFKEGV